MASVLAKTLKSVVNSPCFAENFVRCLSTTSTVREGGNSWLSGLLGRKIEPSKESHSSMLSDKEVIYELQTHNVRPGSNDQYLANYENYVKELGERKDLTVELCGSWSVGVGDQDQCVHLWRYIGGFPTIDHVKATVSADATLQKLQKDNLPLLRSRHNQYLLAFTFWPAADAREGGNIYEIRSYFLKPGTMIEWGNNWARAITFRQSHNEAWGGYFSQVGRLYNVHHIWCYSGMEDRKKQRESAWTHPGWDEVVAYTVPLIGNMHTRILHPTPFSPAQ